MTNLKPQTEIALNNILFATDFSPASEAAFTYAVAIADRYHSRLNVAHVISIEAFDLIPRIPLPQCSNRPTSKHAKKWINCSDRDSCKAIGISR